MAFFGIFIVAWLLVLILIIIGCIILFVFIPCLIISIVNLVNGIRHHWPRRNIVGLAITGSITAIFLTLFTIYFIWRFTIYVPPENDVSSSSEMATALYYLLLQIKY